MKLCTAVLTRGYEDVEQYDMLIKRNQNIDKHLSKKTKIDHLIFHEGNITDEHQKYIQSKTPEMVLQFLNISNIAFSNQKEKISFTEAHHFNIKYRHMCHFWFIDFMNACEQYDRMLRIDEDCFLESNIDDIFEKLDNHTFVTGMVDVDLDSVTRGLNEFSLIFIKQHENVFHFEKKDTKNPSGPYTNLIGFNLNSIRQNEMFKKYQNEVDNSNMIYERRWGDLPLWGEVIYYIFDERSMMIDKNIKYFHQSHNKKVN